ncbi:MAG: hypothetical protein ACYDFU_03115 [Nitrospirota bacterium]
MEKIKIFKALRGAFIIFALLIAMVWVKTYFYGLNQYKQGEKAVAAGDLKDAIADYETAIHMYTPFAGYVPASAQRLWEIGQGFERSGDYDWALLAYRSIRSSFYGVRSLYTPYKNWITRSETQIDEVLALQAQKDRESAPSQNVGNGPGKAGQPTAGRQGGGGGGR